MESRDVLFFTSKKLYDLLMHGLIKIQELDLLIFDECHHASLDHCYNLIMEDFFFFKYRSQTKQEFLSDGTVGLIGRPRILGLTASPVK